MKSKKEGHSRRKFLQTVGTSVPTLTMVLNEATGAGGMPPRSAAPPGPPPKFTPVDLGALFNCSAREFGSRPRAKELGGDSASDGLVRMPGRIQQLCKAFRSIWGRRTWRRNRGCI